MHYAQAIVFTGTSLVAIPGGSGNGLAKSVLFESSEEFSATNATFVALRGSPRPCDLSLVRLSEFIGCGNIIFNSAREYFFRCKLPFHRTIPFLVLRGV